MSFSPHLSIMISHETIKSRKKIIPFFILFSLVIRKENLFQSFSHPRPPLNLLSHVANRGLFFFGQAGYGPSQSNPEAEGGICRPEFIAAKDNRTKFTFRMSYVMPWCLNPQHLFFLPVICLVQDDKGSLLMAIPLGVRLMEAPWKAWAF